MPGQNLVIVDGGELQIVQGPDSSAPDFDEIFTEAKRDEAFDIGCGQRLVHVGKQLGEPLACSHSRPKRYAFDSPPQCRSLDVTHFLRIGLDLFSDVVDQPVEVDLVAFEHRIDALKGLD